MKYLAPNWKSRSLIILLTSLLLCVPLWALSLTDAAQAINVASDVAQGQQGKGQASQLLITVISLTKVMLLTLVPASLCVFAMWLIKLFRKYSNGLRSVTNRA